MNNNDQNNMSAEQAPATPAPLTPPATAAPAAPSAAVAAPARSDIRQSSGAKAIGITTAIVGGLALLGVGGSAAFAVTGDIFRSTETHTVDVTGVDTLDLDVSAQSITVRFGDVPEAELSVTSGRSADWTVERDEETLVVHGPRSAFGWWFSGGWGDNSDADESVVLTLPESLKASELNADIELSGSLVMSGTFGELTATVRAGSLSMDGSATSLDLDVNAGAANVNLDGVDEARFDVSAGRLIAAFTGTAPRDVVIDLSTGLADLTVPDVEYNLSQDVSVGTLDSGVDESSTSPRSIDVTVSSGTVTLHPGG